MTLADELEMRVTSGTDLIFIIGLLVMTRNPESERELYKALHEVKGRLTTKQAAMFSERKRLTNMGAIR